MTDSEEKPERECPWKGITKGEIEMDRTTPKNIKYSMEPNPGYEMCQACDGNKPKCKHRLDAVETYQPAGARR